MPKSTMEISPKLKHLFNEQLGIWKKKNHSSLEDLARLCGVSASYLGHIGRYGRVPSKPVLILLAFNFGLENPVTFFEAAGINEEWPYEPGQTLRRNEGNAPGFLSLKLDMSGFTSAIREIVRSEIRPRSVHDLTHGRPLRVGYNLAQSWFFDKSSAGNLVPVTGFFPEMFQVLSLSLQSRCEFQAVSYLDCFEKLQNGELDIYGPLYSTPRRIGQALYSDPFCRVPLCALGRKRKATSIDALPMPEKLEHLRQRKYEIAVLKDTNSHHLAQTLLDGYASSLIVCDTPEETLERITLSGISRPAHLMFCDSLTAMSIIRQNPDSFELLFDKKENNLYSFENTIAVRPDWPELLSIINEALNFITRGTLLSDLYSKHATANYQGAIEVTSR